MKTIITHENGVVTEHPNLAPWVSTDDRTIALIDADSTIHPVDAEGNTELTFDEVFKLEFEP